MILRAFAALCGGEGAAARNRPTNSRERIVLARLKTPKTQKPQKAARLFSFFFNRSEVKTSVNELKKNRPPSVHAPHVFALNSRLDRGGKYAPFSLVVNGLEQTRVKAARNRAGGVNRLWALHQTDEFEGAQMWVWCEGEVNE